MSLGEKIQKIRKAKGLSQEQLADSLNVSRQAISKWETDQSMPEIEKLLAISKLFSISTDELLDNNSEGGDEISAAKEDKNDRQRTNVSLSKKIANVLNSKVFFMFFTFVCFIAAGICVIVDYAINKQISWSVYPILSVSFFWLVVSPLLFKKFMISLCSFTAAIIPFLFLLNRITSAPDWFQGLALPIAVVVIIYLWAEYLLDRFLKISEWYKAAISFAVLGVIISPIINYIINNYLQEKQPLVSQFSNVFGFLILSAVLGITGYIKQKAKSDNAKGQK